MLLAVVVAGLSKVSTAVCGLAPPPLGLGINGSDKAGQPRACPRSGISWQLHPALILSKPSSSPSRPRIFCFCGRGPWAAAQFGAVLLAATGS